MPFLDWVNKAHAVNRKNRVAIATFKQRATTGHKSINPGMVSTTNFILVYEKDKACWKTTTC